MLKSFLNTCKREGELSLLHFFKLKLTEVSIFIQFYCITLTIGTNFFIFYNYTTPIILSCVIIGKVIKYEIWCYRLQREGISLLLVQGDKMLVSARPFHQIRPEYFLIVINTAFVSILRQLHLQPFLHPFNPAPNHPPKPRN